MASDTNRFLAQRAVRALSCILSPGLAPVKLSDDFPKSCARQGNFGLMNGKSHGIIFRGQNIYQLVQDFFHRSTCASRSQPFISFPLSFDYSRDFS